MTRGASVAGARRWGSCFNVWSAQAASGSLGSRFGFMRSVPVAGCPRQCPGGTCPPESCLPHPAVPVLSSSLLLFSNTHGVAGGLQFFSQGLAGAEDIGFDLPEGNPELL